MHEVDVVVPAFNAVRYIDQAIDSALAQGPVVASIIVVDDASLDGTADHVARHPAPVRLLRSARNSGASAARNRGVAAGVAPFVAFLDADDRWRPGKLDAQIAALAAQPAAAFALCHTVNFVSPEVMAEAHTTLATANLVSPGAWSLSALVVRREALRSIGLFAEDLRLGEGVDWFDRARPYGHVESDRVDVERRLHATNTTRVSDQRTAYLRMAHRHLQRKRDGQPP